MNKIEKIIVIWWAALTSTLLVFSSLYSFSDYNYVQISKVYDELYQNTEKKLTSELATAINVEKSLAENKETIAKEKISYIDGLRKVNNEKIFTLTMELEKNKIENALNKHSSLNNFKNKLLNNSWLVLKNGIWYGYIYENYSFFDSTTEIRDKDLLFNWINKDTTLVTSENWKIIFIKNYKEFRLVSDSIIYWLPWKKEILETLKNIKYYDKKDENLDKDFIELKEVSEKLGSWVNKKHEIIKILYNYILTNLRYEENIVANDYNIYSWIKTFKRNVWVCQWYVELFTLMLAFNNVKADIIKGDVIDSEDFPKIPHAWVKIDSFYYDPTFDDPIWPKETRPFENYKYFQLPEDLMYTNRYNLGKTPEFIKTLTLEERKNIVSQNIYNLHNKYKNYTYNIFNIVKLKKELWILANQSIKLSDLVKKYWYLEINNWKIKVWNSWKYLKKLNYYDLNDADVLAFLSQINFNFSWYKIFLLDWKFIVSNDYEY